MRFKLGLKAWSTNLPLIPEAIMAFRKGTLDFVEVYCVPGSANETMTPWAQSKLPITVHAPHSMGGLNFSLSEKEKSNRLLAEESLRFADAVGSGSVIFHPGTQGSIEETIRQIRFIYDPRMVIENKPLKGIDGSICVGSTVSEIMHILDELKLRFCLDFGHAVAAANSLGMEPLQLVKSFVGLEPSFFHMTDGDLGSELDRHDGYGKGTFPLKLFSQLIPDAAFVTDEASRMHPNSVSEYLIDREYIEKVEA